MQTHFKTIGILGKPSAPDIGETLSRLYHFLKQQFRVFIDDNSAQFTHATPEECCSIEDLGKHCDLIIAAGGDGTFLGAARISAKYNTPLLGVNLGRLGFLTDISPHQLEETLGLIFKGEFNEEHRWLLRTKIIRNNEIIHEQTAVNEVVVHRWVTPSMIEITTYIDGVYLNTQRSDGLIVSTPTGSTAYALSGGGPILHPSLNALVLVPINPHTLSNRPIVINDSVKIEISFSQTKQINAQVTCDHLEIPNVLIGDKILIQKDPKPIRILHPKNHDFFHILREKLHWSGHYTTPG